MSVPPNPFRALEAYTREDSDAFFGRDGDLTLVIDRILTRRTTLLFAASGAGKTSFLQARVAPELEDRFFIAYHNRWSGREPLALVLESVLSEWARSPWSDGAAPVPVNASSLLAMFSAMRPPKSCSGAVLILDQFEEIFQQHGDTPSLIVFVDSLCELVNAVAPDVRVLFSMREEFLGELSLFDNRIPDLFNNYYRLKNPDRRQARSIIVNTVRRSGVEPDDSLGNLLNDLVQAGQTMGTAREGRSVRDTVPPPYLQIACYGLWEKQFSNGKAATADPTFPAGYVAGGALTQLHSYCEGILGKLDDHQRDRLAEALGFLITRRGAKVAYEASALAEHSEIPEGELRALLDRLSAKGAKLFRRTEAADGSTWYELYHDMYAPFLTLWKAAHQKERRARVRRQWLGAAVVTFGVLATIAAMALWRDNSLRQQVVKLQEREISTPILEYRLRFSRHTDAVQQVAFSPDGKHIATVSLDKTAKLWNPVTGIAEQSIASTEALYSLAFYPDPAKTLLAIGGEKGSVLIRDWRQGAVTREWQFGHPVYSLAFDPRGETLACGGEGDQLQLYPLAGGAKQSLRWQSPVNALLYLPTRDLLTADSAGRVTRVSSGTPSVLSQFPQRLVALAATPDGGRIAAAGYDRVLRVMDGSGKVLFNFAGNTSSIWSTGISPDSKLVASGAVDGTIRIWNLENGTQLATLLGHVGSVNSLIFDPGGKTLISGGQDATVRVWSLESRQQVSSLEGEWAPPRTVQFSADLSRIVTEGSKSKTQLWSGPQLVQEFDGSVSAIAVTRDGHTLALGKRDGSVEIQPDAARRARPLMKEVRAFSAPVRGIVFSGNGDVIAVEPSDAKTVRVLDIRTDDEGGNHDTTHTLNDEPAWFVALDESGHSVALAGKHHIAVFDRRTVGAAPILLQRNPAILAIAYDVFGQLHLLYEDGSTEVLKGRNGQRTPGPETRTGRNTIAAVSEDGHSFAFSTAAGEISVSTPGSSDPVHIVVPRPVLVMAFSRDAKRLGTLDETGTARTYSVGVDVHR